MNVQVPPTGTVVPEQVSAVFAKGAAGFVDEVNVTGAPDTVAVIVSVAVVPTGTPPNAPELYDHAPRAWPSDVTSSAPQVHSRPLRPGLIVEVVVHARGGALAL